MTTNAPTKVKFKTVSGDPIRVQQFTLKNGLQLFLSVNKDEPRIFTEIAVRAGSKHDPADTTGLAHYFEHMMFKGTDRLGSLDWESEKPILDKIEQLFEQHRAEKNPDRKRELYVEIDKMSFLAAKLVAANEYDKLVSAIGAKNTNAYTWVEQTVYINDIPKNELERWFQLESERFRRPVLRLFHTELETVFEEYNISQDRDFRKTSKAMQEVLTPTHPYGTQTTLGRGEDLKNPSQTNIYRFFDQYYVPNNMAIILSGDFDPENVVELAEKHFGHFEKKKIPTFKFEPQPALQARVRRDIYGNEAPWVELGWRFPGANSKEAMMLPLISGILYNQQAGLFDLNLLQQQQILEAYAYPRIHEDYCSLVAFGKPREGQSLEDVETLIAAQIENLRNGNFGDWLPKAVVKDLKLSEIKEFEKNNGRTGAMTTAYVLGLEWSQMVKRWAELEAITKEDIVAFAQQWLRADNYVAVFKHNGEDNSVMKVDKPPMTAVELNREDPSEFAKSFLEETTPDIDPVFLDFKKLIKKSSLAPQIKLHALREPKSKLFRLYYIFDMGKLSDRRLGIALSYLPYLGTSKYSATEMQQEFYRLGVHFTATCQDERSYLTLSGLEESFEEAVALAEHLIADAQPNPEALQNLIADVFVKRDNAKKDKREILSKAMVSYAKYGPKNAFNDRMTREELLSLQPEQLVQAIKSLAGYAHNIFYNGPLNPKPVTDILKKHHPIGQQLLKPIPFKKFAEKSMGKDTVFFVNFPMVQVELLLLSRGTPKFNVDEYVYAEWYNQYFGYGLSSIVFQEIRESKALAYSAYAFAATPAKKHRSHFLQAYVGTQPDKLKTAVDAFQTIMEDMPIAVQQIENARQSVVKQIAAERITKADIYWNWRTALERGVSTDLRQTVYETMQNAGVEDLINYQRKHVKGRKYTWMVMGDRSTIDFKYLKTIGTVKELTMEEIFGY